MEVEIGRGKKARRAYGFDDIAIVPSRRTRDPDDVDVSVRQSELERARQGVSARTGSLDELPVTKKPTAKKGKSGKAS